MRLKDPLLLRSQAYVAGVWCDADDGETREVEDPATGKMICRVPNMGTAETRRAIAAAHEVFPAWRSTTAMERSVILRRWSEMLLQNVDDLALIMTMEQGKPLAEARGEVAYAAAYLEWFAEEARRIDGDVLQSPFRDRRLLVIKEPVGVCAAITPWNFPSAMITRKVGPALAAGCPILVKPALETPLSALALAVLAERSGVPPGVLSVLTGEHLGIGGELMASPVVRKLSFTGSTEVGRLLMRQSAVTLKRLCLELGGNAPFIVFDDADLDAAVEGAVACKFRNAGQTCVCANRFYVQEEVYEAFASKLVTAVGKLNVGNGLDPEATQGPLIDERAVLKVEQHIADALSKGARLLCGGKRHALGGTFFEPTVIGNASSDMIVSREETFGPLASLFCFKTEEEAVRFAGDTEFGLAAYFYSRDLSRSWRIAEALECGMVGINTGKISSEVIPFGGLKQSGFGREGSRFGIDEYLSLKCLCFGGLSD